MSSEGVEKRVDASPTGGVVDEKIDITEEKTNGTDEARKPSHASGMLAMENETTNAEIEDTLNATEDDLLEAKELAATFSLEQTRQMMSQVYTLHRRDPNFPITIINRIREFLENESVFEHPEKHEHIITEMKLEAALITSNSPYAEVRSVVDNHDDTSMPCSTIRSWVIGIAFSAAIAFVNVFFEIRQPLIGVTPIVPQLLAYPVGKLWERVLPDWGVTVFGIRHSLNPGHFNKKEHMLITLMASIAKGTPYTNYIIWMQALPHYFNMGWAINFGYQMLLALSANFIGFGLAGLCRRFLVYPSFCVWPASLVVIALNNAFHSGENPHVPGPFKSVWRWSRLKFFTVMFTAMFVYFWFPNSIFGALSVFGWMTWIAPNNITLNQITGINLGLGLNPIPTFDWNRFVVWVDPLMMPYFTTFNTCIGSCIAFLTISGIYFTNSFYTSYLPINVNKPYDNMGLPYNISLVVDDRGIINETMYQAYSPPYLTSSSICQYMFFFATYTATITYGFLYHWDELRMGFSDLINSFRPSKKTQIEQKRVLDVHNRLMKEYKEVPEWWYLIVLAIAAVLGCVAISQWPTYTNPGVVFFGIAIALIFVVPIGIIMAMTGSEVSLNVLSEFIGGAFVEGNALSMCFFKTYGYITTHQALAFSNDLKVAHYLKIPPRITFAAQMVPALVSSFVCVGVVQYQIRLDKICTAEAPFKFTCPNISSYFTSAVLWGTVGPKRLWGVGGLYAPTLVGFPVGVAAVLIVYFLQKKFPKSSALRSLHPVVIMTGGYTYSPYNLSHVWPAVPVAWFSWIYIKKRFLGLWSKYNFILCAAFSCGVAISGLVQFFALAYNDVSIDWWGNTVIAQGCEAVPCTRKVIDYVNGEFFGPSPGNFN